MKLNHLNLVVDDVPALSRVFSDCFEYRLRTLHSSGGLAILDGEDGAVIVLMNTAFNRDGSDASYPGAFHVGFMQESPQAVDAIHRKLHELGLDLPAGPGRVRDTYGFYFHVDTLMIEVGYYSRF